MESLDCLIGTRWTLLCPNSNIFSHFVNIFSQYVIIRCAFINILCQIILIWSQQDIISCRCDLILSQCVITVYVFISAGANLAFLRCSWIGIWCALSIYYVTTIHTLMFFVNKKAKRTGMVPLHNGINDIVNTLR